LLVPKEQPGMPGDRFQPGTKTLVRVVREIAHADGQLEQYRLRHILSVRVLKPPGAAPAMYLVTVLLHKLVPGLGIVGIETELEKQGNARLRVEGLFHRSPSPTGCENNYKDTLARLQKKWSALQGSASCTTTIPRTRCLS
jgi:hypothetical protein